MLQLSLSEFFFFFRADGQNLFFGNPSNAGPDISNDHAFGQTFLTSSRNHAIGNLTNLEPRTFAESSLSSHVDSGLYGGAAHDSLATSGNHTYANPWVTAHPQNYAFTPFVNSTLPQLAESTFPAGAAHNAGIAFPNEPGHYIWVPELAAGPINQYANTNFQYLDPSLSMMGPYAGGIIGNGHGGQLQANGFNTHTDAAGAFSNASYAVNNGNSYGGQYAANSFGNQVSAAGVFPNTFDAVNDYGGQFTMNGLGSQAATAVEIPSAFDSVYNVNYYGGQYAANGLGPQATTDGGLLNTFNVVDDNATARGPAQVAPARYTCPECNIPFKRKADLKRHAKIHKPDSKNFRCVAAGCGYSSYRKDRLDDHVERRHPATASASASAST